MPDQINKILRDEQYSKLPSIQDTMREFTAETQIEKTKSEDFVMKGIMDGKSKTEIVGILNNKHPEINFTTSDINKFLERNSQFVRELEKKNTSTVRRHLVAKTECEEYLANIARFTEKLVVKYDEKGDSTSTIQAINALNNTLRTYLKLMAYGGFSPKNNETNIQVNIDSPQEKGFKKTLEANFKLVDDEPEKQVQEDKGSSYRPLSESPNKEGNNR